MTLHWLSFCDPDRAKGQQFLGVAIVEARDFRAAVQIAHRIGCNPGGEVLGYPLADDGPLVPMAFRDRLLSKGEVEALEASVEA